MGGPLPDMSDHEAMQRFFLQQVILHTNLLREKYGKTGRIGTKGEYEQKRGEKVQGNSS